MIDLDALLLGKEKVDLEVKSAINGLPDSIWETYSSFANTFGGVILLGVEEDKKTNQFSVIGVKNPDAMIKNIWNVLNNTNKISSNILLNHHVYSLKHKNANIVVIEVPMAERQNRPIYIGNNPFTGSYKRYNEGDYLCKKDEVLAMLRDQSDQSSDAAIVDQLNISDLNSDSIRRYRIVFNNKKPSHAWNRLQDDEFLIRIGAAKKGKDNYIHPTIAGLLLFGNYITIIDFLPNYFLDYREQLSSDRRWTDRVCSSDGDWSGNVFDFYFKVIDRLTSDVKRPFKLDNNLSRIDETSLHTAIREALANALIHADYYGRCGIVIFKQFKKIVLSNPGRFRIDVAAAIEGGISDARNVKIFNMFSLIDVGERAGSGLCDLYSIWKSYGYKTPIIEESLNPDRTTLTLIMDFEDDSKNEGIKQENEGIKQENEGINRENEGINEENEGINQESEGINQESAEINRQNDIVNEIPFKENNVKKVYREIKRCPSITTNQIAENLSISTSTAERAIKKLKEERYIYRVGSNKSGNWDILK